MIKPSPERFHLPSCAFYEKGISPSADGNVGFRPTPTAFKKAGETFFRSNVGSKGFVAFSYKGKVRFTSQE